LGSFDTVNLLRNREVDVDLIIIKEDTTRKIYKVIRKTLSLSPSRISNIFLVISSI